LIKVSKEVIKEFALQRLRLTSSTLGRTRADVPFIVRAIGGLQYGGHRVELFNRFEDFKAEWFDYWYENYTLVEGHVLRVALRIVNAEDYPFYFKATRSLARRRKYLNCPASLRPEHFTAARFIRESGPFTPTEFEKLFSEEYPQLRQMANRLFSDLYNYGEIARMGRKNQKPLFHAIEKLPYKLDVSQVSEKEAKKWLLLKCLDTYGPFTPKDITHWTGWNLTETKETLVSLLEDETVMSVSIDNNPHLHYMRVKDLPFLDSLTNDLPENSFIRILFNDDALLLGYYRRLKEYFGYDWKYPQLSEGIVWRAAILQGRELIGDAVVDMRSNSKSLKVQQLTLRKEFVNTEILSRIENEFERHAKFQNKTLEMTKPKPI